MKKAKINYVVDVILFFCMITLTFTGLVMRFGYPRKVRFVGEGLVLGVDKHFWRDVHDWAAYVMILMVIIHLVLHWKWIVTMTKKIFLKSVKKEK